MVCMLESSSRTSVILQPWLALQSPKPPRGHKCGWNRLTILEVRQLLSKNLSNFMSLWDWQKLSMKAIGLLRRLQSLPILHIHSICPLQLLMPMLHLHHWPANALLKSSTTQHFGTDRCPPNLNPFVIVFLLFASPIEIIPFFLKNRNPTREYIWSEQNSALFSKARDSSRTRHPLAFPSFDSIAIMIWAELSLIH